MREYFVIEHAYNGGYWSESYQQFKGWLYATRYTTNASAHNAARFIKSNEPFEIKKMYENG